MFVSEPQLQAIAWLVGTAAFALTMVAIFMNEDHGKKSGKPPKKDKLK